MFEPCMICQYCRAQEQCGRGAREGEAGGRQAQSVVRVWREVWSGEGPNGQGLQLLLFHTNKYADKLLVFNGTFFISVSTLQVALGHDYVAQVEQHSSQKDAAKGFGGKYGVQKDRVDKVSRREES